MNIGDRLTLQIEYVTQSGKGIAFGPDNTLVFVEGISEDDGRVEGEVLWVGHQVVHALKAQGPRNIPIRASTPATETPYELDGEEPSNDVYDDEGEGDSDDEDQD